MQRRVFLLKTCLNVSSLSNAVHFENFGLNFASFQIKISHILIGLFSMSVHSALMQFDQFALVLRADVFSCRQRQMTMTEWSRSINKWLLILKS